MSMSTHHLHDLLLYIPFLIGQMLYILKRAGFSMRAGRATTRRAYFYQNWDILIFRGGITLLIYGAARHYALGDLLRLFHVDLSGVGWFTALNTPINSPLAFFGLGIGADSLVDWGVDWASRDTNTKVPAWIKTWLRENVPPIIAAVEQPK